MGRQFRRSYRANQMIWCLSVPRRHIWWLKFPYSIVKCRFSLAKNSCVTDTATNCSLASEEKLRARCDTEETLSNGRYALRRRLISAWQIICECRAIRLHIPVLPHKIFYCWTWLSKLWWFLGKISTEVEISDQEWQDVRTSVWLTLWYCTCSNHWTWIG